MLSLYDDRFILIYCCVLAGLLGAVMGSFLNCAAWRVAHHESFLKGQSRCPSCGHTLTAGELVPVFSWLIQKGRCRACGARISVRYPLTELFFAAVTVLTLLRFDLTVECLRNYIFFCCLFCLSLVDLEIFEIPDGCHIISAAAWLLALPFTGWSGAWKNLLAAVLFGGGVLLLSLVMDKVLGRESLGGGDVKLIAVAGLYLGLAGSLLMLILACVLGLIFAAARKRAGEPIPFGPSIAAACAVTLLYGDGVINWYTQLL